MYKDNNCLFCKIISKTIPATIIVESDSLLVIQDIHPQAPIHYLILPKEHIIHVSTMTGEQTKKYGPLFLEMAQHLAQQVPQNEFKLKINNGKSAGQEVMHMHWHFLAGY